MRRLLVALLVCLGAPLLAQAPSALDGTPSPEPARAPSVPTNEALAVERACEAGDAEACYDLANRLHGGDGVVREACALGHAPACYDLGVRHFLGEYVARDHAVALALITEACDADYAVACHFGARLVRDGIGAPADPGLAEAMDARACQLGYGDACAPIAPRPPGPEAARLTGARLDVVQHARACDRGVQSACHALGLAYQAGDGAPQDRAHGDALLADACDWGYVPACPSGGARPD